MQGERTVDDARDFPEPARGGAAGWWLLGGFVLLAGAAAAAFVAVRSAAEAALPAAVLEAYRHAAVDAWGWPLTLREVGWLVAAAGVLLLLLLWRLFTDAHRRAVDAELQQLELEVQHRRNQEAILRLVDEMSELARSDLTVHASVTPDLSGTIAGAVNYAVGALRTLVATVNDTSRRVAAAAEDSRGGAEQLASAAQAQAQQVGAAIAAARQLAQTLDAVAVQTLGAAEVAGESARFAREGGERVRRSVQGIDTIRDHIQGTAKRIKRLGESSQEIGAIVELIDDIAEQTGLLALNAAIQAAGAGEAGRGFAPIVDEVQRLAERASEATRRIETLVKTIQSDTGEAILAMERSTTEVVHGAELAAQAGAALGGIEAVAERLAGQTAGISTAAREASTLAAGLAASMTAIEASSAQTAAGSAAAAGAIGELNRLAQELRQSVAGFRLPA